jgi:FMN phosphatase YigB (HAD superfamily)
VITELPRVADGTRAADAVRVPVQDMLATRVRFVQTEASGFDLAGRRLLTGAGPIGWIRLVLALGSRPNDFAIPGLTQRALSVYSVGDAARVWAAASKALDDAAAADPGQQRRLATVVVGGGGATGVELAGAWLPFDDTAPFLRALHARRIPVAVVSNIGWDPRPIFERHDMLALIDTFVLSYEHGIMKPDPGLFSAACLAIGVAPEETAMIGDSARSDGGATAIGCRFAHVKLPHARDALSSALEQGR